MAKNNKIDYELMVQDSLRSVIRSALKMAETQGLPAHHHFYISFRTHYPGVDLPDFLKQEYPDEITIVLQYEFWDLEVGDHTFSVTLCFNDIQERLTVPFNAIVSFVDPSVKFGLQFTPPEDSGSVTSLPVEKRIKGEEINLDSSSEGNVFVLDTFRRK